MAVFDFLKGGGDNQQPIMPPQSYPELGGMYQSWEQSDLQGIVGVTLDNSSLLISIESNLRGQKLQESKDAQTGRVTSKWVTVGEPKMNELGIQSIVMEVRSFLDKNTIMGYYPNENELDKIWERFSLEFLLFLGANKSKFQIISSYRTMIFWHVVLNVRNTMFRALLGNEKEGVYKQVRRIEQTPLNINDPRLGVNKAAAAAMFR
jgi:hypothetical protein